MNTIAIRLGLAAVALSLTPVDAQALSSDAADQDVDGFPGIGTPSTRPPSGATSRGAGLLLIDISHGQMPPEGYDFPDRVSEQGWTVVEFLSGPITPSVLAPFDALMVPVGVAYGYPTHGPGIVPFTASETAAVGSFYASGHGVWIFSEYLSNPAGINSVSSQFGVIQRGHHADQTPAIPVARNHQHSAASITNGVASYTYFGDVL
jgi:hypothetical protein